MAAIALPSAVARVQARGQITLPSEIRAAMGIEPGDTLFLRAKGPGLVEIRVLPRLTLDDLIERYPIEGPINEQADREAWQAEAAKDVIGQ
ncbi:MAG: AbrB/MazE/SpoVT family DNA-binding domain-containing protein [Thermomicrobiales bacterium]